MNKLTDEQKNARKEARELAKAKAEIESHKNQKRVKEMTINIEWKKSRTWGNCPRASASVHFKDGTWEDTGGIFYASGCGYDKESTVIAEAFNMFLRHKLYEKTDEQMCRKDYKWKEKNGAPYGVYRWSENKLGESLQHNYFDGGIGTNCYYAISEFIGGTFAHIACGKTFDVYKFTANGEKNTD